MKIRLFAFLVLTLFILAGCKKDDGGSTESTRSILVYIVADNNLYDDALVDINEMEKGWKDSYSGNLIVFLNGENGKNTLLRISHDDDINIINSEVVKNYPDKSSVCTKEFLQKVIDDMIALYPADSYAIDFWSHGSGWLPENQRFPLTIADLDSKFFHSNTLLSEVESENPNNSLIIENEEKPLDYVFGEDHSNNDASFETYVLADALSPYYFDFIFFDACHMGSVECAYQMKDVCKYFISSAAEVSVDSAPYEEIMSDMFAQPSVNVIGIADKFYKYYNRQTDSKRSCTISVIDCEKFQAVASELKKIVTLNPDVPFSSIQQYGRVITGYYECIFDLQDFVKQTWGEVKSASFNSALNAAVIYKNATPYLFNTIEVRNHCGLSCYIPKAGQTNCLYIYKNFYSWSKDSGLGNMIE